MKSTRNNLFIGIVLTILFSIFLLNIPAHVEAKATLAVIPGMKYNTAASIEDNLKSLVGKNVSVTLDSGKTLGGVLKKVGNHLIHLEKIKGKEFYDALIRIDTIMAVEAQFREMKRK